MALMYKALSILWKFSRPHTIIGSVVSICTLWLLALNKDIYGQNLGLLCLTIIAGIGCNIFIVGLNQLIDIELDKINKPDLPLANGTLFIWQAKTIIYISLLISLISAFSASIILGWLIIVIVIIGVAYSVPPVQLKKHHLPAAFSITIVRGVLVNLGMFLHFKYATGLTTSDEMVQSLIQIFSTELWMLTGFVIAFSIAIAWFKDLPDTLGDAKFRFKTLAIAYSPKTAFYGGLSLVSAAYLCTIYWSFIAGFTFLMVCHIGAMLLFVMNAMRTDLNQPQKVTRFYLVFWIFFFAEYIFFAIWALNR